MNALALDPGTKRIGVAGCDPLGISVKPLSFIPAKPEAEALKKIAEIVAERGAEVVVVGLPVNMDGTEGPAAAAAREFGARLRSFLTTPAPRPSPLVPQIVFWDETLTTDEAEKRLLERGLSHRERKQVIDSLSAAILLKSWLDARPGAE